MFTSAGGFLSKIKNSFGLKLSWKVMIFILIALLLIGIILYYYNYLQPTIQNIYNPDSTTEGYKGNDDKNAELIMFHADWCPHCKTAKPEWETIKSSFEGKKINGYNVIFSDVNCTNETKEIEKMMSTYKVEGFPTIKMIKDGQVIDYDAKPTQSSLTKFINSAI